jgi:hypothetical protein
MPTISDTIQDYEIDQIEMIAEQWGIEDDIDPKKNVRKQIVDLLDNKNLFLDVIYALPSRERTALQFVFDEGGKISASQFSRAYGVIREMGAAVREKDRPDRSPISVAENLFYKGIIGLSFFNEGDEVKEYIFLPEEFIKFLKSIQDDPSLIVTPPALSKENVFHIVSATDKVLDQICSLLAALRGCVPSNETSRFIPLPLFYFLSALFQTQGVTDKDSAILDTSKVKDFLTSERSTSFSNICFSWMKAELINELKLLPDIILEGNWKNDPIKTRGVLLEIIAKLPPKKWYRIPDFIDWMYQKHPDFQRSGGEYNSWFIKDTTSNTYLNGFENWYHVEGKLLYYFLTGPLFWLGILDLAVVEEGEQPFAFRKSKWANKLLEKKPVKYETHEISEFILRKNGVILLPINSQRELHYQIARFCVWEETQRKHYRYRISLTALRRAKTQHISIGQIKILFKKNAKKPIPRNILAALDRWDKNQSQIHLERLILIQVDSPDILDQIEKSPAKRYISERINATIATTSPTNLHRLEDALMEMGYFAEILQEV